MFKYIFGLAACVGVLLGFAHFGISGAVVSVVAVAVAIAVGSKFK